MDCAEALDAVRRAPTLLDGMRRVDALVEAAGRSRPDVALTVLVAAVQDRSDELTAIAAVHALASVRSPAAANELTSLVAAAVDAPCDWVGLLGEHAAWALGSRRPHHEAVTPLVALAAAGGFRGMLAEHTLESWRLRSDGSELGDEDEDGHEDGDEDAGEWLPHSASGSHGLTVVQLFLHADIDGQLTHSGQGDTGGVATLLVRLGDALIATGRVDRVITLSRGGAALEDLVDEEDGHSRLLGPGHHYVQVPLPGPRLHASEAWPLRVAAERGIRRILAAAGPVDLLHLRMADVGSMAAAHAAESLGIPFVLTLAPDPHALIAAREKSGELGRPFFGEADAREHLFFRERLLRALADEAAHLVLFPRADVVRESSELLGLELPSEAAPESSAESAGPGGSGAAGRGELSGGGAAAVRISVVDEGIDVATIERIRQEVWGERSASPETCAALRELDDLLGSLPGERRHLPLAVSLGRLHPVKGMATLVGAWARDEELSTACNLLVVGGDLDDPNDDEQGQLELIDEAVPRSEGPGRGLLLAGHRPNATATVWLAAAAAGRPGLAAPRGVYVSASLKEEFGIAILEALATGLVVVVPQTGGPATYVDEGATGVLCDTHSPDALTVAVKQALALAGAPGADARSAMGREMLRRRFSIERMAASLTEVYEQVAARRHTGVASDGRAEVGPS